ncbi:uncharacterized protein si:ch211-178n15.1 [Triplophysa rosa]|uniref:Protein Largen n=1 Tax=Triplophysa rosa TaxID=992332 RepID=A0A9W7WY81_TRIRA|nr:uncharacterized protein si:ch211-178n15.1 [Triplophysa rosa]KAI7810348.1 hypothetical protein IRJ41_024883 [Triplophysa rosa]
MHSDDAVSRQRVFQTPSCHLCLQRLSARPQNDPNGVAHRTAVLPSPKDLGIADYRPERTGSSPRQVHAEETHRPFYSWGDVRPARWDTPLDSLHAPCTCVREIRRDCGCIQQWYYPEHSFNGCRVNPHPKVRGQRYYREVLYVSEQHYRGPEQGDLQDDSSMPSYNGHCQRRRVSFQNHEERHGFNGPDTSRQSGLNSRCNGTDSGQAAFFPTEVPPGKLGRSRVLKVNEPAQDIRRSQGSESNWRKSHETVREQIKQVVNELEEVLGGLKQVQLEMKEVVQQIDVLTSDIDLGEDDSSPSTSFLQDGRHRSSRTAAVASSNQESSPETSDSSITHGSVSVDLFLMNNPSVMRNHTSSSPPDQRAITAENNFNAFTQQTSESHRTGRTVNGTCLPHPPPKIRANEELENHDCIKSKNHRPPPYPQNGQVKTRTAPLSEKHKTLSSTIV